MIYFKRVTDTEEGDCGRERLEGGRMVMRLV